jgi:hypothetical protein
MSFHSVALALCIVLMTVFGLAAFYFKQESKSLTKDLAVAFARIEELQRIGHEMYLELQDKAGKAAYLDHIVPCLEGKISDLISQAATMNAKRLAEEKRELGARIVDLLIGVFFPGKCGVSPGT